MRKSNLASMKIQLVEGRAVIAFMANVVLSICFHLDNGKLVRSSHEFTLPLIVV